MTHDQEVYAATLNLLGTGVCEPDLQAALDQEHVLADPAFKEVLAQRLAEKSQLAN